MDGKKLLEHFDKAATSIKYPKIKLMLDGKNIVIYRNGSGSTNSGGVTITNGAAYGSADNLYYGKIDKTGKVWLQPLVNRDALVLKALKDLLENPAGFAGKLGKETGCCIFCARELTDASSVYHGYGPTCAENYGLPWGDKPEVLETLPTKYYI